MHIIQFICKVSNISCREFLIYISDMHINDFVSSNYIYEKIPDNKLFQIF